MGRTSKKRNNNSQKKPRDGTFNTDLLDKSLMNNERFATFYKAQQIIPDNEWDHFMDVLRRPLPTTFRIAGSRQLANELNNIIKDIFVPSLEAAMVDGEAVPPPVQIPWYPDGLAWQFNVPKKVLRKSPEFKSFHSFLVFETDVGNISRQEAVSMLPPLFLEVEPHHKVLDMCAAPGSKTAQLLEALHAQDTFNATSIPSGLLIANDSDHKRTHLLIHQAARLPSPALMVTNLDASIYPIIKVPTQPYGSPPRRRGLRDTELLFDKILCDVPCSGDGTLRKNIGIWKTWQPMDGNGLHGLQLRILQRAMRMLKKDGRIVYSTCSINPVENEAVIASALKSNPEFELVDVSQKFPDLKRTPGITAWRPTVDREVTTTFASYSQFMESLKPDEESKMTEGHWPPPEVADLGLDRCLRIYPHFQDTGAFFIAVLQRKWGLDGYGVGHATKREITEAVQQSDFKKPRLDAHLRSGQESDIILDEDFQYSDGHGLSNQTKVEDDAPPIGPPETVIGGTGKCTEVHASFKENPYSFLSPDDPILQLCIKRLNLTAEFPSSNVLVRNPAGNAVRSLYLTNDIVKSIVMHNDYHRIRLTSCGTKVFTKQEGGKGVEAQFRVLGEGLPVVLPFTDPNSIMKADISVLRTLLETPYPLCARFKEPFKLTIGEKAPGSHAVRFPLIEIGRSNHDLVLPIWKSKISVTLMIDKKAKRAMSLRLFGKDVTVTGHGQEGDESGDNGGILHK